MGEIVLIALVIVGPILLVGYLILWLIFKGLERTFTGRIILGVLIIGGGIFIMIAFPFMAMAGLIMFVLGIIWLLLEILLQKKGLSTS